MATLAVDLRRFGEGRSLVLINGRRLPIFPIAANGTDNFIDLSSIPAVAVDRHAIGSYTDRIDIRESVSSPIINVTADGTLGEFGRFRGNASIDWALGRTKNIVASVLAKQRNEAKSSGASFQQMLQQYEGAIRHRAVPVSHLGACMSWIASLRAHMCVVPTDTSRFTRLYFCSTANFSVLSGLGCGAPSGRPTISG